MINTSEIHHPEQSTSLPCSVATKIAGLILCSTKEGNTLNIEWSKNETNRLFESAV